MPSLLCALLFCARPGPCLVEVCGLEGCPSVCVRVCAGGSWVVHEVPARPACSVTRRCFWSYAKSLWPCPTTAVCRTGG
jgi:hypothetical protein